MRFAEVNLFGVYVAPISLMLVAAWFVTIARIGFGYDSHEFKPGVPLRIAGLALEHPEGLAGHSDGDVLLHAVTDAILGSVAGRRHRHLFSATDTPL